MEMVYHQDVMVELSTRLLTAQCEIETLYIQLRNVDAIIQGYMRMVEGQASDLYASDTDTGPGFRQGDRREQSFPLRIPQSLGVT
jgi:hypothetical protein